METDDGTRGVPDGGIWALNESNFIAVANEVDEVLNKLCLAVSGSVPYHFLRKPLMSGLAAGLYLNHLENTLNFSIPLVGNIEEQAQFWIKYYHSRELTADYFVEQVKSLKGTVTILIWVVWGCNAAFK